MCSSLVMFAMRITSKGSPTSRGQRSENSARPARVDVEDVVEEVDELERVSGADVRTSAMTWSTERLRTYFETRAS